MVNGWAQLELPMFPEYLEGQIQPARVAGGEREARNRNLRLVLYSNSPLQLTNYFPIFAFRPLVPQQIDHGAKVLSPIAGQGDIFLGFRTAAGAIVNGV